MYSSLFRDVIISTLFSSFRIKPWSYHYFFFQCKVKEFEGFVWRREMNCSTYTESLAERPWLRLITWHPDSGCSQKKNSLSYNKVSSKEIFPYLAQCSILRKSSTWNRPINISIYGKCRITKCHEVTNVNMCPGVLLFRLSDGYKRYTEEVLYYCSQ